MHQYTVMYNRPGFARTLRYQVKADGRADAVAFALEALPKDALRLRVYAGRV
jgi:hypothetical protein